MNLLIFLTCVTICAKDVLSARILGVFMTPSYSHQVVYQPIWKELSLRGHDVTVITPNPLHDPKLTNLTEIDVSSSYKIFREANEAELLFKKSMLGEVKRFSMLYEKLNHHQFSNPEVQALIRNKNQTFDLLLVEYLYPSMYALKDVFDCPMIGITSLGLTAYGNEIIGNPKNPAFDPDNTFTVSSNLSFMERLSSAAFDIFTRISSKYILLKKLDKLLPQYIGQEIRPLHEICMEFSLVIVNSNLALRNAKPTVPNLIDISGIHLQKPRPLPEDLRCFLNSSNEGVIYTSLGSNMKSALLPQYKLDAIMEVFSQLPYKVLWKFEKEDLPNKPANVEIRKWLPQQDVLSHPNVKLFISQAGLQSIDEALLGKVPMLLVPFFADQHFNAHHMVEKGAALSLDYHTATKEEFKNSILELMNNPKYQNHVDELSSIASDQMVPALEKAVWWIEYVLRHDGAKHLSYSGKHIPFYQFYMLDLLAVFITSVVLFIYISVFTIKRIFQLLSYMRKSIKTKKSKNIGYYKGTNTHIYSFF
ncbi:hypothetical protein HHI36_011357 [Cryptolaemus montrouzieri]|uniref:UDP-glucuronosyltransferase n=1 Tax=Cryptolaemus montrouzieri TaxID=559131 RepID=A0ABD2MLT2_9CUCU